MSYTFQYDQDVDTVFELLTDPDYLVERCEALGESNIDCEITEYDDKTVIEMSRDVERELPSALAKLFSSTQTIKVVEEWEDDGDGKSGKTTMDIVGQPASILATFSLQPTDDGCEYIYDMKAKVKIPIVGKKVEKFILSQVAEDVPKEIEYNQKKLG